MMKSLCVVEREAKRGYEQRHKAKGWRVCFRVCDGGSLSCHCERRGCQGRGVCTVGSRGGAGVCVAHQTCLRRGELRGCAPLRDQ